MDQAWEAAELADIAKDIRAICDFYIDTHFEPRCIELPFFYRIVWYNDTNLVRFIAIIWKTDV